MGDFFQAGVVTTLHNLVDRPTTELETELQRFSTQRPMGLILPSLYSELSRPALENIVSVLADVPYLQQIVVGLDRADEKEFQHALEFFGRLPQQVDVLWNDGPRLRAIDRQLKPKWYFFLSSPFCRAIA